MISNSEWPCTDRLYLKPCICNPECGNYVLHMKADMCHVNNAPEDQFIDIASLSLSDMIDLHANVQEKIELQLKRQELIEGFHKEEN